MKKLRITMSICLIALITLPSLVPAQMDVLHGEQNITWGMLTGNEVILTICNDGMMGTRNNETGRELARWPSYTNHTYLKMAVPWVGAEVQTTDGTTVKLVSETMGTQVNRPQQGASTGDMKNNGEWQTFLPLPGFLNEGGESVALASDPNTWPDVWPDKMDENDPGWQGAWNGYFGKGKKNSDEEAFYYMDDYNNDEFNFFPDSNDFGRRGLGIRGKIRAFQWRNPLVQDIIFWLYDFENVGTTTHPQMRFGFKAGTVIGGLSGGSSPGEGSDDAGNYNLELDVGYIYDSDHSSTGGYTPGYFGTAYLESPGQPFDGIDNDEDCENLSAPVIDVSMFEPKVYAPGDDIVVIDYKSGNFERTKMSMPTTQLKIPFGDTVLVFRPNVPLVENDENSVDDNLNGLIDENTSFNVVTGGDTIRTYLNVGRKYIDYFTVNDPLAQYPMIDERRDDGVDNDGDWSLKYDVGADGLEDTGDFGEGNGIPDPGEAKFDALDINESDQIGLTSFITYVWTEVPLYDDPLMFDAIKPGRLDAFPRENDDIDLILGSGPFASVPGQTRRFSTALVLGSDLDHMLRNKTLAQMAYNANYNFAKAPDKPTVRAVTGDGKVTLYWDKAAEDSYDELLETKDFEGYRIYRSTAPGWSDMEAITDVYGKIRYRKPVAIFDKDNEYSGIAQTTVDGAPFYLGDNSGLVHSWTDSNVVNGQRYFYAVTSYDFGMLPDSSGSGIPPSECTKELIILPGNQIIMGSNVVMARPDAKPAGHTIDDPTITKIQGTTTSSFGYKVIDENEIKDDNTYRLHFTDMLNGTALQTESYSLFDMGTIQNYNAVMEAYHLGYFDSLKLDAVTDTLQFLGYEILPGQPDYTDALVDITKDLGILVYKSPLDSAFDYLEFYENLGIELMFDNAAQLELDTITSHWEMVSVMDTLGNELDRYNYEFEPFIYSRSSMRYRPLPADYLIEFGEIGIDTSLYFDAKYLQRNAVKSIPVNYKVYNLSTGPMGNIKKQIKTGFIEKDYIGVGGGTDTPEGMFTRNIRGNKRDRIILIEEIEQGDSTIQIATWDFKFTFSSPDDSVRIYPQPGDKLYINTVKPFLSNDIFDFTVKGSRIDAPIAKANLDGIKVVPNPYIVANQWEPKNLLSSGRGDRELHFNHLPAKCTIRIFTLRGQLVNTIKHDNQDSGTAIWNMRTIDEMDIAYGVYIYHVDAPGIGTHVGKFAVIK